MAEADPGQSLEKVVFVYTNGRRNPDGSRVVEGVKFLTSQGMREVFVEVEYDDNGQIIAEKGRPLVDSLAKMFYQGREQHSKMGFSIMNAT